MRARSAYSSVFTARPCYGLKPADYNTLVVARKDKTLLIMIIATITA